MDRYTSFESISNVIYENQLILVFTKSYNCTVCDADLPKIEKIVEEQRVKSALVAIDDVPKFAGQYTVFTAPTVLMFKSGKEVFRQARILRFEEIENEIIKWKGYIEIEQDGHNWFEK